MHTSKRSTRTSFFFLAFASILLLVVLAACGSNTSSGGSSTGSAPSSSPTSVNGYGTAYGCPSNAVVTTTNAANVTIQRSQANSTITAHNGDTIEILLPFGQKWSGPAVSQGQLELQSPAGYAAKSNNACVWRFVAKGTGTTNLMFHAQAICKPNEMCPQYILSVPFTITIQ